MPVTKLYVEGELDQQLLNNILGGSPVVERRGGKYGLQGMVLRERQEKGSEGLYLLRDRDFDYEPPADLRTPTELRAERSNDHTGWRWCRHSVECYLLEPAVAAQALNRTSAELEEWIRQAGRALVDYQAARWTIGQARAQLPPGRRLETHPTELDGEFNLPADRSEGAIWTWLWASTQQFIRPVTLAFAEDALRAQFTAYQARLGALDAAGLLVWCSGKDLLAFIAPLVGQDSPKALSNRIRDWVIAHPEEALRLLPEWQAFKTVLNQ